MTTRERAAACSLTPDEAAHPGNCAWCGTPLPRTKSGAIHATRVWCSRACSWDFARNHKWKLARKAALKRDRERCTRCGVSWPLEVNHIVALKDQGATYAFGCAHHLDNLETLCRPCHVDATTAQRRARNA